MTPWDFIKNLTVNKTKWDSYTENEKNDFNKSLETLASLNTADYQTLINEGCVYFKQE